MPLCVDYGWTERELCENSTDYIESFLMEYNFRKKHNG